MHIDIAQRLRPFSHTAGVRCLISGSTLSLQVFPGLLRLYDVASAEVLKAEIPVAIEGPVDEFTVTLDLEKGWVQVQGCAADGFFRYRIIKEGIVIEKSPTTNLFPMMSPLLPLITKEQFQPAPPTDRLSLGNHKAQDWDLVMRRRDLAEVFPAWMRLGQLIPIQKASQPLQGTTTLLADCEASIASGRPEQILPVFQKLFLAGFHGILVPRHHDDQYQGIVPSIDNRQGSSLIILQEGARLIRRLFVDIQGDGISILPAVPPEFHCGRLLHVSLPKGYLDLEWTKKSIRRMIFHATVQHDAAFRFPSGIKRFRLCQSEQDRGQVVDAGMPFSCVAGQTYLLDNFQG